MLFKLAREQQEKIVQAQPDYAAAVCLLGVADAALGRKEDAFREGRRAKKLALDYLQQAIRLPSYTITTYGQLKLLPFWDPLRGDARFEKIVASLTPKDAR